MKPQTALQPLRIEPTNEARAAVGAEPNTGLEASAWRKWSALGYDAAAANDDPETL